MTQMSERHTAKVIGVTVAAAVGGFLFGFDSSVINGAVDSIQGHFELGSFFTGFAVAIALLGCAVGAWFAGRWHTQPANEYIQRVNDARKQRTWRSPEFSGL